VNRKTADTIYGCIAVIGVIGSSIIHFRLWFYPERSKLVPAIDLILFFGLLYLGAQAYRSAKFCYREQDHPLEILPRWSMGVLLVLFLYGALHIAFSLVQADEMRVWTDGENYFGMENDRVKRPISEDYFHSRSNDFWRSSGLPMLFWYTFLCLYFFFHSRRNAK
jgi:hypothetical protein